MKSIKPLLTIALCAAAVAAFAAKGEFGDHCAFGLSMGKVVQTDCAISEAVAGKTYCFSSPEAKASFMKEPEASLAKAETNYAKLTKK